MQWTFEPPIVADSFGLEVVDVRVLAELAQRELVDVEFCDFLVPEGEEGERFNGESVKVS